LTDSATTVCDFQLAVHNSLSSKKVPFADFVKTYSLPNLFFGQPSEQSFYIPFQVYDPLPDNTLGLNDDNLRAKLNYLYFGERNAPTIKANAVEKNFGILDKYFDINSSNRERFKKRLEEILDE
jgi:hypothetical protein